MKTTVNPDKWEENVALAKQYISSAKSQQMIVANLALEVCEITRGGFKKDVYTIKRFANEVGMNPKLLSTWISVRKNVYDKLTEEQRMNSSYSALIAVAAGTSPVESKEHVRQKFDKYKSGDKVNLRLTRHLYSMRGLASYFKDSTKFYRMNKGLLEELVFFCSLILDKIDEYSDSKIKPKNNNLGKKNIYYRAAYLAKDRRDPKSNITFKMEEEMKKLRDKKIPFKDIAAAFCKQGSSISKSSLIKYYNKYVRD